MAFLALLIGAVLIVAAIRNTHGQLLSALRQDVPGYAIWAAAIFGLALIGFVPGLKPVSRGLLALVFVVIILRNYKQILGSFTTSWQTAPSQAAGVQQTNNAPSWLHEIANLGDFNFDNLLSADTSGSSSAVNG